jgi:DNA recombination protein RmuC
MVVKLPGGRNIVVDAKAPKIDLPGDGNFSTAALLKDHIKDLESRNYGARVDGAIDFTVLFVPSEGVLATALTEDLELSEYAFNRKILLATPMTLLALLRAVEFGWKQSDQMQNVKEILVKNFGIDESRVSTETKGSKDPIAVKLNSMNRRVDFSIK